MPELKGSVGRNGENRREDALLVQKLLNQRSGGALVEDGLVGDKTIRAIEQFQRQVVGMVSPDGRIDPGGKTWKTLSNAASSGLVKLSSVSTNFYKYSSADRQFGTEKTIASLLLLARRAKESLGTSLGIGDISFQDGRSMPPHTSHRKGMDVDIRPIRSDKRAMPVKISDKEYDAALTKKLVELARKDPNLLSILFNDKKIPGVKSYSGHDNHLHLRFRQ